MIGWLYVVDCTISLLLFYNALCSSSNICCRPFFFLGEIICNSFFLFPPLLLIRAFCFQQWFLFSWWQVCYSHKEVIQLHTSVCHIFGAALWNCSVFHYFLLGRRQFRSKPILLLCILHWSKRLLGCDSITHHH